MILYNILAIFLPVDLIMKNKEKLLQCSNFVERIETARSFVPTDLPHLHEMETQAGFTLRQRFEAVRNYEFSGTKLKSVIKLYKAANPPVSVAENEDYRLGEYCERKVEVLTVKGNHVSVVEQEELVSDVSKLFELDL